MISPQILLALALHWIPQTSPTTASLRGLSVVSAKVIWASGSKGTILRTLDAGQHWEIRPLPSAETLDFRDIEAFDANTALVMASGTGTASRVYLTQDGGNRWSLVLADPDRTGFFDALKFWDRNHGILLGDPVNGRFVIFTTQSAGQTWTRSIQPAALAGEGAFAASGTSLALQGIHEAWFGTGGPNVARVFHTSDAGQTWTVAPTPLSGPTTACGIFSLLFLDPHRGVAIGGDYQKPDQTSHTAAFTDDGGRTWTPVSTNPAGYRSGVASLPSRHLLISVGTNGADYSSDAGHTWTRFSNDSLNAVASHGDSVWAIGPKGQIAELSTKP